MYILDKEYLSEKYYYLVDQCARCHFKSKYADFKHELTSAGNDAFMYVLDNLNRFSIDTECKFEKFVRSIIRKRMINCVNRDINKFNSSIEEVDILKGDFEDEIINRIDLKYNFNGELNKLTATQKRIVELYFGLNGNIDHSLSEVASFVGTSKRTIRVTKDRALKKLRNYMGDRWEGYYESSI